MLRALRDGRPGQYQLQAAISAVHADAADPAATDWPQIVSLYDVLRRLQPSPVVELNRAVAVAMADGPRAGLKALEPVLGSADLRAYAPLHVAHAELLQRDGDLRAARLAYRRAITCTENEPQRAYLARRLAEITSADASIE